MILRDFHHFPPVARLIRDALYYPSNAETDSLQSQIGRAVYEEFQTVVTLKEQKRVSDPIWLRFLRHLRVGQVCDEDLKVLRSLIIGKTNDMNIDFSTDPWKNAALVTPRHAVRKQWNGEALRKFCRNLCCFLNVDTPRKDLTVLSAVVHISKGNLRGDALDELEIFFTGYQDQNI